MPPLVITGGQSGTLRAGLRDAFDTAYESQAASIAEELGPLANLNLPSGTDQEVYAYYKDAPHPRYHPRGENMPQVGFDAVQFTVPNYDWSIEVPWHKNDEADDQLRMLRPRVADAGENYAMLDHRLFFQLLTGTTDAQLLPNATPNAPDGAGLFSTTDGASAARFGATSGNLLTGTGVASSVTIRNDAYSALEQFGLFKNTQNHQLWPKSVLDQGIIVMCGTAIEQAVMEAFNQNPTIHSINTATSNASVQNIFAAAGKKIEVRSTQYITDNDIYVFLRGAKHKAIFSQDRQPVVQSEFDENNSAEHARSLTRSNTLHARKGWGIFLPYSVIKINN